MILAVWLIAVPIGWLDHPAQAYAPTTATAHPIHTPTAAPTETATLEPTATSTPTAQPVVASPVPTIAAAPQAASVPLDVILVGVVMIFALIGIVIGFRRQRV